MQAIYVPFLGTLIAAIIAGFGAYIVSRRMHWLQTKRDIYMDVAVAFSKGIRVIATFIDPNVPMHEATAQFVETADAPVKAHVVAGSRLSKAIMNMGELLSKTQAEAMSYRMAMTPWEAQIMAAEMMLARINPEIDAILAERTRYNVEGTNDARRWEVLSNNLKFQEGQRQHFVDKAQTGRLKVRELVLLAGESLMKKLQSSGGCWTEVIGAMREELGHKFDSAAFLTMHNALVDAAKFNVDALRTMITKSDEES
ncbi:hypothetical protein [Luteibacter sp. RCC_6_2]|uniref:hypothetical protein n=1 Tax=Luteibacter sp. RCC_6_2 TaxID=3239223 RepID=UPI0035261466